MADVLEATTQAQPAPLIEPSQGDRKGRPYMYGRGLPTALALGGVMLISLFMNRMSGHSTFLYI